MNKTFRIALGSLLTESNHLGGRATDISRFEQCELKFGSELLAATSGAVSGMVGVLGARDIEIAPLLVATACPGGPLTRDCHVQLKSALLARLDAALPVDGVLLSLHGAAAAEGCDDIEGDLLQGVRKIVGNQCPIVATLDPHAHVTQAMVKNADALLAFETYPHIDTFQTGARGARMILDILDGTIAPFMALAKVPVLVSGVHGSTEGDGPFARVMQRAKAHEGRDGVLSTSVFLVHPYLDVAEMGGGALVITNGDPDKAESLAREIAAHYWEERFALEPETFTPGEAIAHGLKVEGGPVLLVECADCAGGGASGDSVHTLRALLDADLPHNSLASVVDEDAATLCHQAGIGRTLTLHLGHKTDAEWGVALRVTGTVESVGEGRFQYTGGIWQGTQGQMGKSAVLRVGSTQILITSNATYDWADEQFQAMELQAENAKFVVVKNPMNYQLGYASIAKAAFILDTPGPTPATLRGVTHHNLQRPYFPADEQFPDLQPTVYASAQR